MEDLRTSRSAFKRHMPRLQSSRLRAVLRSAPRGARQGDGTAYIYIYICITIIIIIIVISIIIVTLSWQSKFRLEGHPIEVWHRLTAGSHAPESTEQHLPVAKAL